MENKTNKQKLIEYLYKYTSKELTFGCEIVTKCVVRKLTQAKINELEAKYGKCMLLEDFYNLPNGDDDYIEVNQGEYTEELRDMADVARVISPKPYLFQGVRVSQKTHTELTAYPADTHTEEITVTDKNKLFSQINWASYRIHEIIGHPPQWHHLLLALRKKIHNASIRYDSVNADLLWIGKVGHEDEVMLNLTTNLKDMPEDTAEKLCKLLNIG